MSSTSQRPRQFDLIAFDWDGTLFDSTAVITRCIQRAVADVGGTVPSTAQAAYVIGMALVPALAHAAPDVPAALHGQLAARYRHHYAAHHYAAHHSDLTLFDGVLEVLMQLKSSGHTLAVATGKNRKGLDEALDSVQLRGVFDGSRTADETAGKPDPRMLHELMAEFGVRAERTLMVGDTTHDLQMARNAGCACLAVSYGAHSAHELALMTPVHLAHSVSQMQQWLHAHA